MFDIVIDIATTIFAYLLSLLLVLVGVSAFVVQHEKIFFHLLFLFSVDLSLSHALAAKTNVNKK